MAKIYLTDGIKKNLDELAEIENRKLVDEVNYLVSKRLKELTSVSIPTNSDSCPECQEQNLQKKGA